MKTYNNTEKIEDKIDINNLDWEYIWQKSLFDHPKKEKDWNTISKNFENWLKHDDYPDTLINEMEITKNDTVLDIGCGEGTISLKLAKLAKSVTAIDRADLMLERLDEKAKENNINNINTIQMDIEDINPNTIDSHDIIIASRCLNGIFNIKETLKSLNEIANKYVYITLFGLQTKEYKKEKARIAGKPFQEVTDYIIAVHILKSLGIEANVIQLDSKNLKKYKSIDEAIERTIWKLGEIEDKNKENLRKYFEITFIKDENNNLINPKDKTDWVLIWWKVNK